jgi:hypothetical protein
LNEVLLDDTDVEIYDWRQQTLLLTEQASLRLRGSDFMERIFVVTLGDERLYGGITLPFFSPRSMRCPVLTMYAEGNRIIVILCPAGSPSVLAT